MFASLHPFLLSNTHINIGTLCRLTYVKGKLGKGELGGTWKGIRGEGLQWLWHEEEWTIKSWLCVLSGVQIRRASVFQRVDSTVTDPALSHRLRVSTHSDSADVSLRLTHSGQGETAEWHTPPPGAHSCSASSEIIRETGTGRVDRKERRKKAEQR